MYSLSKQSSTCNLAGTTTLPASHTNTCFECVLLNHLPSVWCNWSSAACCRRCSCCCHSGGRIRLHPALPFYIPQCVCIFSKLFRAVELNLHTRLVSNTVKNFKIVEIKIKKQTNKNLDSMLWGTKTVLPQKCRNSTDEWSWPWIKMDTHATSSMIMIGVTVKERTIMKPNDNKLCFNCKSKDQYILGMVIIEKEVRA